VARKLKHPGAYLREIPFLGGISPRARIKAGRLPAVQILRAFAALSVVLGHTLYEAKSLDPTGKHLQIADTANWNAGVDLFFVLSGFIMMWTFGHRFGEPRVWLEFLKRRLLRIIPPYWIFTALTVVATLLFANRLETAVFTPQHALLSFLFIPHISPRGGIHPILALGWTLMYEMFFYLSFALVLCFPRKVGLGALVALFFLVHGLARCTGLLPEALRLFWGDAVLFEFLFGVAFFFVQGDGELRLSRLVWVLLLCVSTGAAAFLAGVWSQSRVYHFGLPALAVFALFYYLLPDVKARICLFLVVVGEASYTLYLSHPFVLELVKIPIEKLTLSTEGQITLYLVTGIAAATLFSLAFYALLEHQLPGWMIRRSVPSPPNIRRLQQ
jgi:exopolysaccharide production protein ExoZ